MSEDLHTLVGAYALDAVSFEERDHFEQHLHKCVACRDELAGLEATTSRLGVAVAAPPNPELRVRVLAAAARTPQERTVMGTVLQGPWHRWGPRLLAAAAVLAVVASIGAFVVEQERRQDVEQQQVAVSAVLAAEDAEDQALTLDNGARLRVVSSPSLGQAVVVSSDMPEAGPGKDYEVWAVGEEGPVSAGLMKPGESGRPQAQIVDGLDDASTLAITVEPEGGSPSGKPSTKPIATVDLA